ncbi:MAG: hypothetical protein ACR2J8_14720, partial [Thermomicrobiales bacterium]
MAGSSSDQAVGERAGKSSDEENEPAANRSRLAVLAGWKGFALASVIALWVIFALWLLSSNAPISAGEPFRFTPPPDTPPVPTSVVNT